MIRSQLAVLVLVPVLLMLTGCSKPPSAGKVKLSKLKKKLLFDYTAENDFLAMNNMYDNCMSDIAKHGGWGNQQKQELDEQLSRKLLEKIKTLDPLKISVSNAYALNTTVNEINNAELTKAMNSFQEEFNEAQDLITRLGDKFTIVVNLKRSKSNAPMNPTMNWQLQEALVKSYSEALRPLRVVAEHAQPFAEIDVAAYLEFESVEYVDAQRFDPSGASIALQSTRSGKFFIRYSKNLERYASTSATEFRGSRKPTPIVVEINGRVNSDYSSEFYDVVESSRLAEHLKIDLGALRGGVQKPTVSRHATSNAARTGTVASKALPGGSRRTSVPVADFRTWTRRSDGKTVRAQLVAKDQTKVSLRLAKGRIYRENISALSDQDAAYIRDAKIGR